MSTNLSITKLTVDQLKKELSKYGLDTRGRKGELLARLVDHLDVEGEDMNEGDANEKVDGNEVMENEGELDDSNRADEDLEEGEECDKDGKDNGDYKISEKDEVNAEESKEAEEDAPEIEIKLSVGEENEEDADLIEKTDEMFDDDIDHKEGDEKDDDKCSVGSGDIDQAEENRLLQEEAELEEKDMKTMDDPDDKKSEAGEEGEDKEKAEDKIRDLRIDEDDFEKLTRGQLATEAARGRDSLLLIVAGISPQDLTSEALSEILKTCASFNYQSVPILAEENRGASYCEITFINENSLTEAEKKLKEWREDIKTSRWQKGKSTTDLLSEMGAGSGVLGQVNRTVCVLGVPKTMEESELHEIFPGLMTVTGEDKTGTSTGHRFVEFATEEEAEACVEKNQELIMDKHRLCVFVLSNAASGSSTTPEEGKPLTPIQMHRLFDEWMDMRMEITKQWSEQYPSELLKLVKEHDTLEEKFRVDEKLKEKLHLPGADIWRRILARRTARAALDIYNVRARHLCRLQTDSLFDLLNKRIKRMQEIRDERSTAPQPSRGGRGGRGRGGRGGYRGRSQNRNYGGDTRGYQGNRTQSDRGGRERRESWNRDDNARGSGQKRQYQQRDRYDNYGNQKRQRYDSRSNYNDTRDSHRVDNPLYHKQQGRSRDTAANALDLLVGLSQMIGKGEGGQSSSSSNRDSHYSSRDNYNSSSNNSNYSQQYHSRDTSTGNNYRSHQKQSYSSSSYSKPQSYRSNSARNSYGSGSSSWN